MRLPLSYQDVRRILALVDAWPSGRIHFESGNLVVDAITTRDAKGQVENITVLSPAVGIFKPESITVPRQNGKIVLLPGTCLGHIDAPLRSTPVLTTEEGRIVSVLVGSGGFVEYGQPLVMMEQMISRS